MKIQRILTIGSFVVVLTGCGADEEVVNNYTYYTSDAGTSTNVGGSSGTGGTSIAGGSSGSTPTCGIPGATAECACPGGSKGAQSCKTDGTWNTCVCLSTGTGGSSGAGGNTGQTGGQTVVAGAGGSGGSIGGFGGTGGSSGADAQAIVQCPPSVSLAECDQGRGWALCEEQPLAGVPRPSIIKGSGSAIYWYASSGIRYVFPNTQTFRSWFPEGGDCPMVYRVSDYDLASVAIGGNVRIKPGSYLIKITTDPKVYAISCGGIIHWVESEKLIADLYGTPWQQYVIDVPDAFFVNYAVGTSISSVTWPPGPGQYDPVDELYNVPSPDQDFACRPAW